MKKLITLLVVAALFAGCAIVPLGGPCGRHYGNQYRGPGGYGYHGGYGYGR